MDTMSVSKSGVLEQVADDNDSRLGDLRLDGFDGDEDGREH